MTEKTLAFEGGENLEQKVVRLLKERGVDNPEAMELLNAWTIEQEEMVDKSNDPSFELIQFNLRRARLYLVAGYIDEAFENFKDAAMQAWNDGRDELFGEINLEIRKEFDRVEDSSGGEK